MITLEGENMSNTSEKQTKQSEQPKTKKRKNLAIIASRLKFADGVSIEADKWINEYIKLGYNVFLITGKLGEPTNLPTLEIPHMDYKHSEVRGIKRMVFGAELQKEGIKAINILIENIKKRIKPKLKQYIIKNKIEVLSIEDFLGIPTNIPLTMAVTEIIKDLKIPTVARHHHLCWNNEYFTRFKNLERLNLKLPLDEKNVVHVVTTEFNQSSLKEKT